MQYADTNSDSIPSHDGREESDMPPPKRTRTGKTADFSVSREVGVMRDGVGNTPASFVGSASGISFIRSVYNAMGASATETTSPAVDLVPGEDDRLASESSIGGRKMIWLDHEIDMNLSQQATTVTFDNFEEWTASYFDVWHPIFPFLHAPTILELFETATKTDVTSLDPFDVIIIRSLHSLSLADRRQSHVYPSKPVHKELVFLTFDDALQSATAALLRPVSIKSLQAVTCVQLFLVSMLRLNAASRLGGLIVQMAFQLGLHRCPKRFEAFSVEEGQLRKRLFWSIYCLERYLVQALGLPLTIHDEDVDVCFLNKEQHNTSPKSHHTDFDKGQLHHEVNDTRLQLLSFLTQHAQLRGAIMELRNKKVQERDRNPDAPTMINARLIQWWNEIEDFLDQQPDSHLHVSNLHRAILETLKHESVIMLNRPLLALRKDAANYSAAIHICIGAAKSILTILTSLLRPVNSGAAEKEFPPMVWPSFTWAAWMSAFIIFYASTEGKVDAQVASRNIDKSMAILKCLAKRGSVWPQACAVAIENLHSNLQKQLHKIHNHSNSGGRPAVDSVARGNHPTLSSQVEDLTHVVDTAYTGVAQSLPQNATRNGGNYPTDLSKSQEGVSGMPNKTFEITQDYAVVTSNPQQTAVEPGFDNYLPRYDFAVGFDDDGSWQNLSFLAKAMPQASPAGGDPLLGFDIPFWMGQDNYVAWMNDNV